MDKQNIKECVIEHDYCGSSEAAAKYDKYGTLVLFWSSEIGRNDKENISRSYDPARFENTFIHIPNLFERGDVVRLTTEREGHGIVATSKLVWKEFLERVESGEMKHV